MCTIIIVHNTARQRQFLFIFPFLQTNVTSQMWPSGGKIFAYVLPHKGVRSKSNHDIRLSWYILKQKEYI